MLETLRQGVQSWYFKALLVLLIGSFAIWGVGDIFRDGPAGSNAMTVGGKEVGGVQIYRTVRQRLNLMSRQLGSDISMEQAQQLGLIDQTIEAIATETLYDVEADELGVVIGNDPLRQQITEQPGFRNAQGQFDRNIFEQIIAANGMTEQGFVNQLRNEFVRDQIIRSLAGTLPQSSQLTDRLFNWQQERRVAEYIVLKSDPTAETATPDDAALRAFHTENPDRFTAPAYRKIVFVHLTTADAQSEVEVSDEELQQVYENRIDQFSLPDRRTLQQMIFADEAAAKAALTALAEGRDFVALAEELVQQDPNTTNLGDVSVGGLPDNMSEAVFRLGAGETSAPIEGPFGWYVIRVTEVKPASAQPLSEVGDELRQELAAEKAVDVLFSLSNALEDGLGGGATLEEAASQIGVRFVIVDAVDRFGRAPDGEPVLTIPTGSGVVENAFAATIGIESQLLESADGGYMVIRVDSETPSALRPFDSVRNDVIAAWKAEQRLIAEEKRAEDMVARLNAGTTITAIANEFGLDGPQDSAAFTRQGVDAGAQISRALASDLFAAKTGQAAYGTAPEGFTIAVLKDVRHADTATDKAAREAFAETVATNIASDLIVQYANALRQKYTVEIDRISIDNMLLQN